VIVASSEPVIPDAAVRIARQKKFVRVRATEDAGVAVR
jgi:hypothetical protein